MSWVWDAAAGVYKDHALSSKIRTEAMPRTRFMRFLRPEPGYGKRKGQSITVTRFDLLPLAGRVSETERLPVGRPSISTINIVPGEWGFVLELTQKELDYTYFAYEGQLRVLLRNQFTLTMDKMGADTAKLTPYKYIPVSTGGVFDTDGTPSTTADVNLAIADLRNIYDEMSGTLKVPFFANETYVMVMATKAARGIKSDPEYKDWLAPSTSDPLRSGSRFQGQVVEGFALYETNHFDALSNALGASGVLGEAVAFGDDWGALAVIDQPEVRRGMPFNLGRFIEMGWVGHLDAGLIWPEASRARVVHVTSA